LAAGGSGGIGRAVVERLARVGIAVGVHYAGNKARTTTVTAAGGRAIAVGGDIADEPVTAEASDAVEQEFSGIDAWSARKALETGRRSP
jgi:3-oxoacyl-[acyl-carrier protein] reductase